jgi:hypothetical protein
MMHKPAKGANLWFNEPFILHPLQFAVPGLIACLRELDQHPFTVNVPKSQVLDASFVRKILENDSAPILVWLKNSIPSFSCGRNFRHYFFIPV